MAFFIVFEGGEGSGKTGALKRLSEKLKVQYPDKDIVTINDPGATVFGNKMREFLLNKDVDLAPETEYLVYTATRAQTVYEFSEKFEAENTIILCDRWVFSSLAYQTIRCEALGETTAERMDSVYFDHLDYSGGLMPDMLVFLDVDPKVGIARSKARLNSDNVAEDKFENLDMSFHNQVRDNYLTAIAHYIGDSRGSSVCIDTTDMCIDDVDAAIYKSVIDKYCAHESAVSNGQ
jgi:dTMP kinase